MKMAVIVEFNTDMASPLDRFTQIDEYAKKNLTQSTVRLIYVVPEQSEIDVQLHVDSRWSE